jgi:3'-phosphoadenosine 5'-phosphosulfate sulfotransferase (PAPS reductase)/FAD synthetase
LLYNLVVGANGEVIENRAQREREYMFLLGYLSAEIRGKAAKDRVQTLRLAVPMFLESVIILDAAIAQLAAERLNGQPVLFRDCSLKLEEQLQMAEELSEHFNLLARAVDAAEINLEELRNSLQSETDRQISIWVRLAHTAALSLFGTEKEVLGAIEQSFLLFKSNSGEASDNVADP